MRGRWMTGPPFLAGPKEGWPEQVSIRTPTSDLEEKKPKAVYASVKVEPLIDPTAFSSWQKLLRVTAFCFRCIHNLKCKKTNSESVIMDSLQTGEIQKAENYWIVNAQGELADWQERCRDLAPFMKDGIVRVGGRLRRSELPYDQKHPILLPSSAPVSKLILRDVHGKMGHPGAERTLCDSRRNYWVLRGRNLVREIVKKCTICRKLRQPPSSTLMADLPPDRLRPFSPPFSTTGVDLFGPFNLRYGRNKTSKAWGALFTCGTVRAIHLEIIDGLSTQSFLQALRRFVAYHGWSSVIISDNGTSFTGAEKELRKLLQEGRRQIQDFAVLHKVKWKFITPLSPHQGGFYESLIKQAKRALKVVVGGQTLTWNEMSTVFAEATCLVNSRPIGYSPDDPNDPRPLTPNHFLLGRASADIPQGPFDDSRNLRKRFEFVQTLVNNFWRRFIQEYLPTLARRAKWTTKGRQAKIGDIVLLVDANLPRGKWDLARVVEVYPGKDDIVRNVKIRTKTGEYRRSIQRCCPIIEVSDDVQPVGPPRDVK